MNGSRTYEQSFYSTFDLVKISVSFFFLNTIQYSNLTFLSFYYREIFPEMGEITKMWKKKKLLKFRELILFSACTTHYISLHPQTLNVEIRIFVLAEFPRKIYIYIYICMQTDFRNRIQISLLNKRATIIQMCTIQRQTFNEGWDGSSTGMIRSEEIKLVLGENLRDSPSIKWTKKNLILFFPSNFSRLILFFFSSS